MTEKRDKMQDVPTNNDRTFAKKYMVVDRVYPAPDSEISRTLHGLKKYDNEINKVTT